MNNSPPVGELFFVYAGPARHFVVPHTYFMKLLQMLINYKPDVRLWYTDCL
jgi:hypothetical protein